MTRQRYEKKLWVVEKHGAELRARYGDLTDEQIYEAYLLEEELQQCNGCTGQPCRKSIRKNQVPTLTKPDGTLDTFNYKSCRYEQARYLQWKLEKKYKLSRIPAEYVGMTFENYVEDADNALAVRVARKLIATPDKGAFFYGKVGTGKTLLAAIVAQEVLRQGRQVIFATVPVISAKIRSTFQKDSAITEIDILEELFTVPTLILDDVGMEKPTRFLSSTISNIFNERYNARLQTILTSNYNLGQLEYIFNNPVEGESLDGTRLVDRCKQMCIPIELKGGSRR